VIFGIHGDATDVEELEEIVTVGATTSDGGAFLLGEDGETAAENGVSEAKREFLSTGSV